MKEYILIVNKEDQKEVPPEFLVKNNQYACRIGNSYIEFISFGNIKTLENSEEMYWNKKKKEVFNILDANENDISLTLFSHGIHAADNDRCKDFYKLLEKEKFFSFYIDYSGNDPFYNEMWDQIRNCADCGQLLDVLKYWVGHYRIDFIKRIKHRFINKFIPVIIDLERMLELIEEGDEKKLEEQRKAILDFWNKEKGGPTQNLIRLWYVMIGGEGLKWGKSVNPPKPKNFVLPKYKDKEWTIYDWLKTSFGAEKIKEAETWNNLLDHCQLIQVCDDKFKINKSKANGIYSLSKEIEKEIGKERHVKKLTDKIYNYIQWFNKLNDYIENLTEICTEKP